MTVYGLILFPSTKVAMEAEKKAKKNQLVTKIIATPTQLKATCGFSLKYQIKNESEIFRLLQQNDLTYEGLYHVFGKGLHLSFEKIDTNLNII